MVEMIIALFTFFLGSLLITILAGMAFLFLFLMIILVCVARFGPRYFFPTLLIILGLVIWAGINILQRINALGVRL